MKFLIVTSCIVFLISCKQNFNDKTYEENKTSLAQRESTNPQQFLKITSDNKRNLFGATVINGKIINTASVAAFKNTRIKMLCYHNGIRVEEHEDVMPDIINPGSSKSFKIKYHLPKGTDSLSLILMSADTVSSINLKK